ncbi:MAG: N-formylglutamate amidohydrolase [Alphaproteobacteria bacterium]
MSNRARVAGGPAVPLLGPGEPPAVEVVNPGGRAPLVLICDHASRRIPRALDSLGLDRDSLKRHIAWDIGAARVARRLSRRFDAPLVLSGYSRLVIDCNRRLADPTSIPAESEDTMVPGNQRVSRADARERARTCFKPYHRAIVELLGAKLGAGLVPALVSVHSFTPVYHGERRPWHVGVLWNRDPRIPVPLLAALRRRRGVVVGDNKPYTGRDRHGYSIEAHGARRGLPHALLEFRQDLVEDAEGARRWADLVGEALEDVLGDPGLYRVRRY